MRGYGIRPVYEEGPPPPAPVALGDIVSRLLAQVRPEAPRPVHRGLSSRVPVPLPVR